MTGVEIRPDQNEAKAYSGKVVSIEDIEAEVLITRLAGFVVEICCSRNTEYVGSCHE